MVAIENGIALLHAAAELAKRAGTAPEEAVPRMLGAGEDVARVDGATEARMTAAWSRRLFVALAVFPVVARADGTDAIMVELMHDALVGGIVILALGALVYFLVRALKKNRGGPR